MYRRINACLFLLRGMWLIATLDSEFVLPIIRGVEAGQKSWNNAKAELEKRRKSEQDEDVE